MATRRRRHGPPGTASERRSYSSPACYLHEFESAAPAAARGFEIKRIYDPAEHGDGFRVLVDRLWPRGVSKQRAALDEWLPEIAPSPALRKWFHQDHGRWPEFARRYRVELRAQAAQLQALRGRATQQRVTLLYGARDNHNNHAVVLRAVLRRAARRRTRVVNSA